MFCGQFLELVDEVVAYRAQKAAGYAEGFAGKFEGKGDRPHHVHLVCALQSCLLVDGFAGPV